MISKRTVHFQLAVILKRLYEQDTITSALSWTLHELATHPDVVQKLRREILDVVGPVEAPTFENLKNMKYLRCLINEVMRLYPPSKPYIHFPILAPAEIE